MIYRIINGERVLMADVNKLEAINSLEAGADKNLKLTAEELPFYHDYECKDINPGGFFAADDPEAKKNIRAKITELGVDLANNWGLTNKNRTELAVVNKTLYLRFNPNWTYAPKTWAEGDSDATPPIPGQWVGPDSVLHVEDPVLAALFDQNGGEWAELREWWLECQTKGETDRLIAPGTFIDVRERVGFIEDELDSFIKKEAIGTNSMNGKRYVVTGVVPSPTEDGKGVLIEQFVNDIESDSGEFTAFDMEIVGGDNRTTITVDNSNPAKVTASINVNTDDLVKSINGEAATAENDGEIIITGTKIPVSGKEGSRSIASAIRTLTEKTKLSENEKILSWSTKPNESGEDEGSGQEVLKSHLSLTYNGSKVQLLGKDKILVSEFNLVLGSALVYNDIVNSTNNILALPTQLPDGVLATDIQGQFGTGNADGQYLILGFKDSENNVQYSFANLSEIIEDYIAGDGIDISDDREISIKIDADSPKALTTSEDGLKLDFWTGTQTEFDALTFAPNETVVDNIYFVIE